MTLIDADILKHSAMVQFFRDNFSKFFQKQCRKEKKQRSSRLTMFVEQRVLDIKKKKLKKFAGLRENLVNFLEKFI